MPDDTMPVRDALKACPFCGSAEVECMKSGAFLCDGCGMSCYPGNPWNGKSDWNRRVTPDAPSDAVRWRHKKTGGIYTVVNVDVMFQASGNALDEARVVIYCNTSGMHFARPYGEFHDGRFELIAANTQQAAEDGV